MKIFLGDQEVLFYIHKQTSTIRYTTALANQNDVSHMP